MPSFTANVVVREVGLRDGLQSIATLLAALRCVRALLGLPKTFGRARVAALSEQPA